MQQNLYTRGKYAPEDDGEALEFILESLRRFDAHQRAMLALPRQGGRLERDLGERAAVEIIRNYPLAEGERAILLSDDRDIERIIVLDPQKVIPLTTWLLGQIILFAGNYAPKGWGFCDGSLRSISRDTALFSILGTTYDGNGTTDFALPDLRSHAPHGGANYIIAVQGIYRSRD